MRHVAIRKIARTRTDNKKYLEKLRNFFKDKSFKEFIVETVTNPNNKEIIELNNRVLRIMSFVGKEMEFSPFERSHSTSELIIVSMRHGFQTNFISVAPL